ncbi:MULTISPECIES: hypothetical protein [unclassified Streptomyces]|uniref:hypothetical protein n=1 Tax=unclassified Streptomyces TaxID=2593676 RepID=UPI0036622439
MEQTQTASQEDVPLTKAERALVERAWELIAATLDREADSLDLESRLVEDLGADEDALANIASVLEEELDLDGLYEEIEDWTTVDDVLESVLDCADDDVAATTV